LIQSIKLALAVSIAASTAFAPLFSTVEAQHDMSAMAGGHALALPLGIPLTRLGSGTSWLPDSAPARMAHLTAGDWTMMVHGAVFPMYDRQTTLHGDSRFGLIDWEMLMAARPAAGGALRFSAMTSVESLFLPDTGYAELLQTGESFHGRRIANVQHPHDLFGELAVAYDHSLTSNLASSVYVALVGEPALGPVAYMHRPSAAADPFAPLGHHWQDGAHTSAGVVTAALFTHAVKLEASAFNGREADENRLDLDYGGASLNSYAGRLTVSPSGRVALSAWAGYVADHDPLDPGTAMQRYGASLLTETRGIAGGSWSTSFIWGLNNHHHGARSHVHDPGVTPKTHHLASSALIESTLGLGTHTDVYLRLEQVQKMGDDLGFLGGDLTQLFNVRAVTIGATRDIVTLRSATVGFGARGTLNVLPESLRPTYQETRPVGFAVFLRIRP
jgi:hypothetical protein